VNTILSIIFLLVALGLLWRPLVSGAAERLLAMPSWRPFVWLNLAVGISLILWSISVLDWFQQVEWVVLFVLGALGSLKGLSLWIFPDWSRSLAVKFIDNYWRFALPLSMLYLALALLLIRFG
jgi:hypothetical protein